MTNVEDIRSTITIIDLSSDEEDIFSEQALKNTANLKVETQHATKPRNVAVKRGATSTQNSELLPQEQPQQSKANEKKFLKDRHLLEGSKFLEDFNPEYSRREMNKRHNLFNKQRKPVVKKVSTSMYDEQGKFRISKKDVCDCFELDCPGCHFPCENCKSQKCGTYCRVNRKWTYEMIEYDGKDLVKTNPFLTTDGVH